MLWSKFHRDALTRAGAVGRPLSHVWGGHNAQSDFRGTVEVGDVIVPVLVADGRLHLAGRMVVGAAVHRSDYLRAHPEEESVLYDQCGSQVLVAREGSGSPVRFDRVASPELLARWRFLSRQAERPIRQLRADGRLANFFGFQGVYRLSPATAAEVDTVFAQG